MKDILTFFLLLTVIISGCQSDSQKQGESVDNEQAMRFRLVEKPEDRKVDVMIDGKLFTSYIYPEMLKKPVLWPVKTASDKVVTRSYPLDTLAGERVDHPHHIGIWLNYGDVNGLDFWNNSQAIPADHQKNYGHIDHTEVTSATGGPDEGVLEVTTEWKDFQEQVLLSEETRFRFQEIDGNRVIDRRTRLTALDDTVHFNDNKEGMLAIRVTRQLELPSKYPSKLTDAHGKVTKVPPSDSSNVHGDYLSSEGITGADVWGTRAKWMKLFGELDEERVSITIMDHPSNVGFPTYWHAREYGLFSANPLGQEVFTEGKKKLNFKLNPGESTTFNFRVVLASDTIATDALEQIYKEWSGN